MNCVDCRARLMEFLYGETAPDATRAVEEHLAICSECRAELEKHKSTLDNYRSLPRPAAPRVAEAVLMAAKSRMPATPAATSQGATPSKTITLPLWKGLMRSPALAAAAVLLIVGIIVVDQWGAPGKQPSFSKRSPTAPIAVEQQPLPPPPVPANELAQKNAATPSSAVVAAASAASGEAPAPLAIPAATEASTKQADEALLAFAPADKAAEDAAPSVARAKGMDMPAKALESTSSIAVKAEEGKAALPDSANLQQPVFAKNGVLAATEAKKDNGASKAIETPDLSKQQIALAPPPGEAAPAVSAKAKGATQGAKGGEITIEAPASAIEDKPLAKASAKKAETPLAESKAEAAVESGKISQNVEATNSLAIGENATGERPSKGKAAVADKPEVSAKAASNAASLAAADSKTSDLLAAKDDAAAKAASQREEKQKEAEKPAAAPVVNAAIAKDADKAPTMLADSRQSAVVSSKAAAAPSQPAAQPAAAPAVSAQGGNAMPKVVDEKKEEAITDLMIRARQAFGANRYREAAMLASTVPASNAERRLEALELIALCWMKMGDKTRAAEAIVAMTDIDPEAAQELSADLEDPVGRKARVEANSLPANGTAATSGTKPAAPAAPIVASKPAASQNPGAGKAAPASSPAATAPAASVAPAATAADAELEGPLPISQAAAGMSPEEIEADKLPRPANLSVKDAGSMLKLARAHLASKAEWAEMAKRKPKFLDKGDMWHVAFYPEGAGNGGPVVLVDKKEMRVLGSFLLP